MGGVYRGRTFYRGVYLLQGDGTCRQAVLDLDAHGAGQLADPQDACLQLGAVARELRVDGAFLASTSRSGEGRHARLCLDPSTPAWLAQELGRAWLKRAGLPDNIERFPGQSCARYGNLIALPCHLPLMREGRAALLTVLAGGGAPTVSTVLPEPPAAGEGGPERFATVSTGSTVPRWGRAGEEDPADGSDGFSRTVGRWRGRARATRDGFDGFDGSRGAEGAPCRGGGREGGRPLPLGSPRARAEAKPGPQEEGGARG